MDDKPLRLLGLCLRAGKLVMGERAVGQDCRGRGRIHLIVLARDAAENTVSRAEAHAEAAGVPLLKLSGDCKTLGRALGRNTCAVTGVADEGLARKIRGLLEAT